MQVIDTFDVIVVGGGHAGTEAALASARMSARTLLLTHNIETLGQLSCNPSIGGIGKSQLVREIDALGGAMALAADHSGTHFRILNASKGPAVRATRAQVDRQLYKQAIRGFLENQAHLSLFQGSVEDLLLEKDRVVGVITQLGSVFRGKSIVLTAGTFLNGRIYVGQSYHAGGRAGEAAALKLAERLGQLNVRMGRLKTGTPARLDGRTIDFSQLEEQPTENVLPVLSSRGRLEDHPKQISCFITRTNEKSHRLIHDHLHQSLICTEHSQSLGPRYCPSIETKVRRFADKASHPIFLEREGLSTYEVYPNGLSTSLPFDIQVQLVRSIKGLEKAHLTRGGYAVEYDFLDPRDLLPSLESKLIAGLFCAGQINGTTGYEEAAAQGIIAGLNAALAVQHKAAWLPRRDEAYIGVLIDDLVTQGTIEPYRMFTSRAEYRLSLREDNADLRLTEKAYALGLIEEKQWKLFNEKKNRLTAERERLSKLIIRPDTKLAQRLEAFLIEPIRRDTTALQLLTRSEINYAQLMKIEGLGPSLSDRDVQLQLEIQARYGGYIERQHREIQKHLRHEMTSLDAVSDYHAITALSHEVREKLVQHKPSTVGQASRISGVTPAAISILLVYLKKQIRPGGQADDTSPSI